MPYLARSVYPLSKGVHLGLPPHRLPAGFSPRVRNLRIHDGDLFKRPGLRAFVDLWRNDADNADIATAAGTITGLFEYQREDGNSDVLAFTGGAAIGNRRIYKYSTARWLNITDPTLYDGAGNNDLMGLDTDTWDATVAPNATDVDVFYASNGNPTSNTCEIVKFTGSGTAVPMQAGPGPARYLATFANRLILGHVYDTATGAIRGNRVAWSNEGDAETWGGASSGAVDLIDTPDVITRLLPLRGRLVIYKPRAIYLGIETGISTIPIAFEAFANDIGTPAGFSVNRAGGVHFFLARDNVYVFDGTSPPRPIGDPIRPALADINFGASRQIFSMIENTLSEYWLFVPEGDQTYAKAAWVYNWAEGHWSRWEYAPSLTTGSRGVAAAAETWSGIDAKGTTWSEADASGVTWAQMTVSGPPNMILANSDKTVEESSELTTADGTTAINTFWESADVDLAGENGLGRPLMTSDMKTLGRVSVRLRPGAGSMSLTCEVSGDGGQTFKPAAPTPKTTPAAGGVINFDIWLTADKFRIRLSNTVTGQGFPKPEEVILHFIPREPLR